MMLNASQYVILEIEAKAGIQTLMETIILESSIDIYIKGEHEKHASISKSD